MMSEEFLNPEEMQSFNEERNRYLTELREGTEVYCKENKKNAEKRFDKYATDFYDYLLYCINETNKVEQLIEPSREECELKFVESICYYDQDYDEEFYECSACENKFLPNPFVCDYNFCPNCGAKIKK